MYLAYGISDHGELIYIDQARRGKTGLKCPYCGGELLARKGEIMVHHFAHAGQTCRQVERDPETIALPAYDNFNLHLPGKVVAELNKFHSKNFDHNILDPHDVIKFNGWAGRGGSYELTHKGKLVLGELSLMLFNEFQEPLIVERHTKLEEQLKQAHGRVGLLELRSELDQRLDKLLDKKRWAEQFDHWDQMVQYQDEIDELQTSLRSLPDYWHNYIDYETASVDLRLYRAQWQRILKTKLYFLEVRHSEGTLYKIGVTTREIDERIAEIRQDLVPHFGKVKITVLGTWEHRGNVELYFKYRYKKYCTPVGSLSEYYTFEDVKSVLRDLRRMKTRELTDLERQVLSGDLCEFENELRLREIENRRKDQISKGMKRAKRQGKPIGRPTGTKESIDEFLAKPKNSEVIKALQSGRSMREAAEQSEVALSTVVKIKRLWTAQQKQLAQESG